MARSTPDPRAARDAAEFIGLLRELKERSGYTYRQLEERAAGKGEVLPRSTTADLLRRDTLPRHELLAAFVRACDDEEQVARWLAERDRLATVSASPAPEATLGHRGFQTGTVLAVAAALVALLAFGGFVLLRETTAPKESPPRASGTGLALPPDGSFARLRPARTPDLCVTEGRDRAGQYGSAIAAQRHCADAIPPSTFLKPVGNGELQIQWHHPVNGVGCLTVLERGPVRQMLEPRDDCGAGGTQLFRVEKAGESGYRLRPGHHDDCLGIKDNERTAGAEVVRERCAADPDQEFLIELTG